MTRPPVDQVGSTPNDLEINRTKFMRLCTGRIPVGLNDLAGVACAVLGTREEKPTHGRQYPSELPAIIGP